MIDRIHGITIDESGKHVGKMEADFSVRFPASQLEPKHVEQVKRELSKAMFHANAGKVMLIPELTHVMQSNILAAANAAGFYGEDAERFARECDNATEFLIGTVSAPRRDRRRMKRADRTALKVAAMRHAGVPEQTIKEWQSWLTWLLSAGSWVAPPPWNIVIAAVLVAVERFLGGGETA